MKVKDKPNNDIVNSLTLLKQLSQIIEGKRQLEWSVHGCNKLKTI